MLILKPKVALTARTNYTPENGTRNKKLSCARKLTPRAAVLSEYNTFQSEATPQATTQRKSERMLSSPLDKPLQPATAARIRRARPAAYCQTGPGRGTATVPATRRSGLRSPTRVARGAQGPPPTPPRGSHRAHSDSARATAPPAPTASPQSRSSPGPTAQTRPD